MTAPPNVPPGVLVGTSWREAALVSGGDAYVMHHLAPAAVREVRRGDGWWAVVFGPTSYFERGGLHLGGDPARVGAVAEDLGHALRPTEVTTGEGVLGWAHPDGGSRWAWLHTTRALPRVPGEDRVSWTPDPVRVSELLDEANPDAYVRPGGPTAQSWAAVAGPGGRLLGCGAVTHHRPGVPHLSSIAVSPTARRQGLGAALTVAMTRHLLRTAPAVSLALWSGNTGARALYDRIGFTGGHDFDTRAQTR